jgi:hypothetical protein
VIDPYLEDLERRIDPAVERELHEQWVRFADGRHRHGIFCPRRPASSPPGLRWPHVRVNETLDDSDRMALQQLGGCSQQLQQAGGLLLCVRCNYGTGILPSLFGAELFVMPDETDTLPTVRPVLDGADAARALLDRGLPDLRAGLGSRVFDMAERFLDLGRRFPNAGAHVHLYHPDLQGPMDVAELLWGSRLFLAVVDTPELVTELLELVTRTYVEFMRRWEELVPPEDGHSTHWGLLHRGHIMLRDDSAMNFSPALYEQLIRPYDQRLLDEFGGGAVHFCGRGDHYIEAMAVLRGLHGINMAQPELNDMDVVFRSTLDRGIPLLGLDRRAAEAALAAGRDLRGLVHCY